jgi:hypothetical protein
MAAGVKLTCPIGQRFGALVISGEGEPRETKYGKRRRWLARCDCGADALVDPNATMRGRHQRCAACAPVARDARMTRHGCAERADASATPEYRAWMNMHRRCSDESHRSYKDYGQRGVSVTARWDTFEAFLADMGARPSSGHSLDREDNNLGYGPDNCRWATADVQNRNKRNNVSLTLNGVTRTAAEWARSIGISHPCLMKRIAKGEPLAEALTRAPRHWRVT